MPQPHFSSITATAQWDPPDWALWQRRLIGVMNEAAIEFVDRYARPDGTLIWRTEWPGMDGSDDPYEGFHAFVLLYMLGGGEHLLTLARRMWEAITWQWTEYGQIYREFDAYYDWMHHGESSLLFYFLGLADPASLKERVRAVRFAGFYTGDDPTTPNYDLQKRMMRSPITGSRGPRFVMTAEDWCTHRPVLDNYPPPFEDIPGVAGPLCHWSDDTIYGHILERMNSRMAHGDVPLNLTATGMAAHAFLYTGDDRYRRWVLEYLAAWQERTERNGGITPDNVGPSGEIGELMDGKWWGGYYGWRWPHGSFTILEPLLVAGCNATLLDSRLDHLELVRSQLDKLWSLGRQEDGRWIVPHKHLDAGWTAYHTPDPVHTIYLWFMSQRADDLERVERLRENSNQDQRWNAPTTHLHKGLIGNTAPWFQYIQGQNPDYPAQIMRATYEIVCRQIVRMRAPQGDPATWDVHHWQDHTPVITEGLTQLMLGAPIHVYHGGLLHTPVRYYDALARRPGLPENVAALVESIAADAVTLTLGNLDPLVGREVIVQAGAFSEHRFEDAIILNLSGAAIPEHSVAINDIWLRVILPPGTAIRVRIKMQRYAQSPTYATPWLSREQLTATQIQGRTIA